MNLYLKELLIIFLLCPAWKLLKMKSNMFANINSLEFANEGAYDEDDDLL